VKIFVYSEIPIGLERAWLEHLQAFDRAHPDCKFFATIESASMPIEKAVEMLKEKGMTIRHIFRRMDSADGLEESTDG
jgi:hypothetical protein